MCYTALPSFIYLPFSYKFEFSQAALCEPWNPQVISVIGAAGLLRNNCPSRVARGIAFISVVAITYKGTRRTATSSLNRCNTERTFRIILCSMTETGYE